MPQSETIFETKHLLVRPVTLADVEGYLSFWNDALAMKFIGDGTWGGGEDVVKKVLEDNIAFYQDHEGLGFWAVINKTTGKLIGEGGLGILHATKEVEAGFLFAPSYWGLGLGTELCKGLLDHGFETLGYSRIVAVARPDNLASIRVLSKCGMVFEHEMVDRGVRVLKFHRSVEQRNHEVNRPLGLDRKEIIEDRFPMRE